MCSGVTDHNILKLEQSSNNKNNAHTGIWANRIKLTHTYSLYTNQDGTLGVKSVGAAHVDASVSQELEQADVVVTVHLKGDTNTQK